jgi:hypothetical protein
MAPLSQRARRIIAAGEVLYGAKWQSPLGRAAGVPQSLLAMIVSGVREPTDNVCERIAGALIDEAARLRKAADRLDEIGRKMKSDLE